MEPKEKTGQRTYPVIQKTPNKIEPDVIMLTKPLYISLSAPPPPPASSNSARWAHPLGHLIDSLAQRLDALALVDRNSQDFATSREEVQRRYPAYSLPVSNLRHNE